MLGGFSSFLSLQTTPTSHWLVVQSHCNQNHVNNQLKKWAMARKALNFVLIVTMSVQAFTLYGGIPPLWCEYIS
jgi:hypothetical protein